VPHGLEMGPFSYYPEMPCAQAEKLNLLNEEMLVKLLSEASAPVAAFSGYGLSIASPEIKELSPEDQAALRAALQMNYTTCCEVEHFGQAHTTLEIFHRTPER